MLQQLGGIDRDDDVIEGAGTSIAGWLQSSDRTAKPDGCPVLQPAGIRRSHNRCAALSMLYRVPARSCAAVMYQAWIGCTDDPPSCRTFELRNVGRIAQIGVRASCGSCRPSGLAEMVVKTISILGLQAASRIDRRAHL